MLSPLTSTLAKIGKVALKRVQNSAISSFDPGSWPPNWLLSVNQESEGVRE